MRLLNLLPYVLLAIAVVGIFLNGYYWGRRDGRDEILRDLDGHLSHVRGDGSIHPSEFRLSAATQAVVREWDERGDGGCTQQIQEQLRAALGSDRLRGCSGQHDGPCTPLDEAVAP